MKSKKQTRRFGRTAGDEWNVLRASPFTIGFNSQDAQGKNFMKKFKKYALPFVKKHGLRTTGQSLKNYAEGKKPLDSIKSALNDEFQTLFSNKSIKKKSKKSKKSKKTSIKLKSKKKSVSSKKLLSNRAGFTKIY